MVPLLKWAGVNLHFSNSSRVCGSGFADAAEFWAEEPETGRGGAEAAKGVEA